MGTLCAGDQVPAEVLVSQPSVPAIHVGDLRKTYFVRGREGGLRAAGLEVVDALVDEPSLEAYHLLPSVRGDFLYKLGRFEDARTEFTRAAEMTHNARERRLLLDRAAACHPATGS